MNPTTSTLGTALNGQKIPARRILEHLNDPRQQRESYPFMDEMLGDIDLAATDLLHGWTCAECSIFEGPFSRAFVALVALDDHAVYRRTDTLCGPASDPTTPPWRWEHTGYIQDWVVEVALYPPAVSGGLLSPLRPMFARLPEVNQSQIDGDGNVRFGSALEALGYANALTGGVDEHGMPASIRISPREVPPFPWGSRPGAAPSVDGGIQVRCASADCELTRPVADELTKDRL